MDMNEFMKVFVDLLQRDEPVSPEDSLADLEEWDSLAIMSLIAWFDKTLDKRVVFEDFEALETVADVAAMAGVSP